MKTSLKLHRLQRGMKQSDLADLVNVRRETIGRLEQGQYCPSLRLPMDLARVFGTTVEDLFSLTTSTNQNPSSPSACRRKNFPVVCHARIASQQNRWNSNVFRMSEDPAATVMRRQYVRTLSHGVTTLSHPLTR